jgi:hypothetical protein
MLQHPAQISYGLTGLALMVCSPDACLKSRSQQLCLILVSLNMLKQADAGLLVMAQRLHSYLAEWKPGH